MGTTEAEGDKPFTSHLDQEERGFTRRRAERRLRRDRPADRKSLQRTTRGEGVNS